MSFKRESLLILVALTTGLLLSGYIYSKGEGDQAASLVLAFLLACSVCFVAVLIRFHGAAMGLGFFEKKIKYPKRWIICVLAGSAFLAALILLIWQPQEFRSILRVGYSLAYAAGCLLTWHMLHQTKVIWARSPLGIIFNILIVLAGCIIIIFGFLILAM